MPLSDRELWSAAAMVLATHGEQAPVFVAERIGALAPAGDAEGIGVWQAIARRIVELGADAAAAPAGTY